MVNKSPGHSGKPTHILRDIATMALENQTLTTNDKVRLNQFMDAGMKTFQEIQDLRDGLKDTAKTIAEELDIKPAILMKALRLAFKATLEEEKEAFSDAEEILEVTGRR